MSSANPYGPVFRVGDLVRLRRYDSSHNLPYSLFVPIWASPLDFVSEECDWVPGDSVAVIVDHFDKSYRILSSSGQVGWADTWDLELIP